MWRGRGRGIKRRCSTTGVNIVKQQVAAGGCPTLKDTLIQLMEVALNPRELANCVSDKGAGAVGQSESRT